MFNKVKTKENIGPIGPCYQKNKGKSDSGPQVFYERRGDIVKIHRANDLKEALKLRRKVLKGEVPW